MRNEQALCQPIDRPKVEPIWRDKAKQAMSRRTICVLIFVKSSTTCAVGACAFVLTFIFYLSLQFDCHFGTGKWARMLHTYKHHG
ncbi:MAG: hypothetical protein EBW71_12780, partial [Betaproteobacteria bacterium]|nr:hypothetical protein [Betaproteobacteria bacterium]